MYEIKKKFEFDYGHRVHNQKLSQGVCKCRRIHGHSGVIELCLSSEGLTNDMVLDYNELGFFKRFLDDFIDHRTLFDRNDPMLKLFGLDFVVSSSLFGFSKISNSMELFIDNVEKELYDSIVLMDGCPTSENICRTLYMHLKQSQISCLKSVSFKETNKTEAIYFGEVL